MLTSITTDESNKKFIQAKLAGGEGKNVFISTNTMKIKHNIKALILVHRFNTRLISIVMKVNNFDKQLVSKFFNN